MTLIGALSSNRIRLGGTVLRSSPRVIAAAPAVRLHSNATAIPTTSSSPKPRTRPYFHDGSLPTLPAVVDFFDHDVQPSLYLAAPLKDDVRERRLQLSNEEKDALVMFLRSLEGTPVDAMVATPPR